MIKFADIVAAFLAQQSLNNFYLTKYNASLSVKWLIKKSAAEEEDTSNNNMLANQENVQTQQMYYPNSQQLSTVAPASTAFSYTQYGQ